MVDRCICHSKTFSELKSHAETHHAKNVLHLQEIVEFGQRCGLCKPYVQKMLDTGLTAFPVMQCTSHPFENPALFDNDPTQTPG